MNKPVCTPAPSATTAATATAARTKRSNSRWVDAKCVEFEDMGVVATKYGNKPMVKFTFEADEINQYGSKRRLTRMFHKHFHPESSLSVAAKSWCDRCLADEEETAGTVDLESFVGKSACLKLEPGAIKDGIQFENITEIKPGDEEETDINPEPKDNQ